MKWRRAKKAIAKVKGFIGPRLTSCEESWLRAHGYNFWVHAYKYGIEQTGAW